MSEETTSKAPAASPFSPVADVKPATPASFGEEAPKTRFVKLPSNPPAAADPTVPPPPSPIPAEPPKAEEPAHPKLKLATAGGEMPPEPPAAVKASDGTESMKRSGVRLSLKKEEPAPKPAEPAPAPKPAEPAPTPAPAAPAAKPAEPAPAPAPKPAEPAPAPAPDAPKAIEPPAPPKAAPVFKKINQATPAEQAAKASVFNPAAAHAAAPHASPVAAAAEPAKPALVHNEPKFDAPKAAPVMKEPEPTAANYAISAVAALLFVGIAFAVVAFFL